MVARIAEATVGDTESALDALGSNYDRIRMPLKNLSKALLTSTIESASMEALSFQQRQERQWATTS